MTARYAPGALVTARGRDWVVLPESEDDMLVLRPLAGADDAVAAVFLGEGPGFEAVTQASFDPPSEADLGDFTQASLLRTALRIGFTSSAGPFRSLAAIAVEPRPYQLVPLLMALKQDTVRLAICDDVGIGKTIESGLIAAELLAQGSATGLAVLCSPALAEQWREELRTKFGINAELILPSTVTRLERALPYGASLFAEHRTVIISTDFIKAPRHRDDFVRHAPDLVIVDEAHACVPAREPGGMHLDELLRKGAWLAAIAAILPAERTRAGLNGGWSLRKTITGVPTSAETLLTRQRQAQGSCPGAHAAPGAAVAGALPMRVIANVRADAPTTANGR